MTITYPILVIGYLKKPGKEGLREREESLDREKEYSGSRQEEQEDS